MPYSFDLDSNICYTSNPVFEKTYGSFAVHSIFSNILYFFCTLIILRTNEAVFFALFKG
jgi:hypothetical protein